MISIFQHAKVRKLHFCAFRTWANVRDTRKIVNFSGFVGYLRTKAHFSMVILHIRPIFRLCKLPNSAAPLPFPPLHKEKFHSIMTQTEE